MKPYITLITLGVDDLERAVAFYRDGLGLETEGIVGTEFEHGAVAFFTLDSGLKLALWPRASLAHDIGRPAGPASATEFSIAHNVGSRERGGRGDGARRRRPAPSSSSRPPTPSTAAMRAISRIPTGICGRSRGTRPGKERD